MFRKMTSALALTTLIVASACNTTTGIDPQESRGASGASHPQRVCLDSGILFVAPQEYQSIYRNNWVMVEFDVSRLCGDFTVTLSVSYDNGPFEEIRTAKNVASMTWLPAKLATVAELRVVADDRSGTYSDVVKLHGGVDEYPETHHPRGRGQRD